MCILYRVLNRPLPSPPQRPWQRGPVHPGHRWRGRQRRGPADPLHPHSGFLLREWHQHPPGEQHQAPGGDTVWSSVRRRRRREAECWGTPGPALCPGHCKFLFSAPLLIVTRRLKWFFFFWPDVEAMCTWVKLNGEPVSACSCVFRKHVHDSSLIWLLRNLSRRKYLCLSTIFNSAQWWPHWMYLNCSFSFFDIQSPHSTSWKDPALSKVNRFCRESRCMDQWVPIINLPERWTLTCGNLWEDIYWTSTGNVMWALMDVEPPRRSNPRALLMGREHSAVFMGCI